MQKQETFRYTNVPQAWLAFIPFLNMVRVNPVYFLQPAAKKDLVKSSHEAASEPRSGNIF